MLEPLTGTNRIALIVAMAPARTHVVDVGSDHGHVAAALGAIASEREPHRLPNRHDVPRVVANGLQGHRNVELAILTGMGPRLILSILDAAAPPEEIIVHSPQHAHVLRYGLAERGWRVHREGLAPENGKYAEVIHLKPGRETSSGYPLGFGPSLEQHPWAARHAGILSAGWKRLLEDAPEHTRSHKEAQGWIEWLSRFQTTRPG